MNAAGTPPNVVVVLTDQQRWDTLGAYENPMGLTPTLDRLAREGTVIEQAISPQPLCGPFRAAFQTGKYATETGVWQSAIPLAEDEQTLAHLFSSAGYDVGYVGNWHLASTFDDAVPPAQRGGYDDFWIAADVPEFTTQPHEGELFDADGRPVSFDDYRVDAFTEFAIDGIESLSEPFFLVVGYVEPHDQNDMWTFVAPDGYADRHAKNPYVPDDLVDRPGEWHQELPDYYGIVERIDERIADLLDALSAKGVRDRTLLAYTSDHGCHFRTRPGEHKRTPHESAVRVPLVLSGPGFDNGRNVQSVRSLVDLPSTLLDVAGIDVPDAMRGDSLLPIVHGDAPDADGEAFIQVSESQVGRALRTDRWKYAVAAPAMTGWRGGSAEQSSDVYVERYLYDLWKDPGETVNLAGRPEFRGVANDLRERLLAYISDIEGEQPTIKQLDRGFP
ncbi:sulfatase-like hydrolase/transferase [Halapricum desulfuricans]|uniref:sulfatase-like hydrolase/transferase n=1 Tax=Halapricum desulfuricans TaxID=2841257 RepID=UPI001E34C85B|nr:sulfatase-like hydrolase/transferase [Halapricum desulfuricans]